MGPALAGMIFEWDSVKPSMVPRCIILLIVAIIDYFAVSVFKSRPCFVLSIISFVVVYMVLTSNL